jgi:hypothetical protein
VGTLQALFLPAVQHELVQGHRTAHGGRQAVALLYRQDDLDRRGEEGGGQSDSHVLSMEPQTG